MRKAVTVKFKSPGRTAMSKENWQLCVDLKKRIGFLPNLYAYFTKSESALNGILELQNRKTSLDKTETEAIKLLVSELNHCSYCQSAHTDCVILTGLTKEQTLEIRKGFASFDPRLQSLLLFTSAVINQRGQIGTGAIVNFLSAGYTESNLVDVILTIGEIIIANYIQNIVNLENDFPVLDNCQPATDHGE